MKKRKILTEEAPLIIKNTTALNNKCRDILRNVLNNNLIHINETKFGDKLICSITGGNGTSVITKDNKPFWVVPLISSDDGSLFWLNYSITFQKIEPITAIAFMGTSIRIFKGMGYSPSKELLFRAEWDAPKSNSFKHEQPHWHIYPEIKNYYNDSSMPRVFIDLINEEQDTNSFKKFLDSEVEKTQTDSRSFELSNFHFAMGSQWHIEKYAGNEFKENELPRWLNGTISYIIEQLNYLTK